MQRHTKTITVGRQTLVFETGKIARQANGAVLLRSGETIIFGSACATPEPLVNCDFVPLRVDYQEKFSSAGKTVGGFFKREGRPTERETLISRLIDRPIRPMIQEGYYHDTQVLCYVWSYDGVDSPDPLAICAASAALTISDIPLVKPLGAVRVGYIDGEFVINPHIKEMQNSKLDLMIAGTEDAVLMIEGHCDFLTEEQVIQAIETGHKGIRLIAHALTEWQKEVGKPKNLSTIVTIPAEVHKAVADIAEKPLSAALRITEKKKREEAQAAAKKSVKEQLLPQGQEPKFPASHVERAYKELTSNVMRNMVLNEGKRCDGRGTKDIRFIDIESTLLPRAHGSVLFTRGETQTVAVCTLGGENMAQRFETLENEGSHRFYLQYTFPPFSVGEVGRVGAPGRREMGHGKLAERAILPALPPKEKFPYTIRIESNITESNGSSSMASVCGGCLALMDAGVPIERPVSGIAMGLVLEKDRYVILSDILGVEDALGDMDFKISGDKDGITSFQMDIKVEGITHEIIVAALEQAKEGRVHILNKMLEAMPKPRALSTHAPRMDVIRVKPSKIATIIGPGGKQIRAIIEQTGVQIDINDDGMVSLSAPSEEAIDKAKAIIYGLTADIEVGAVYSGKITSIVAFGLFVEVLPGKEGLCHISEYGHERIQDLNTVVKQGDVVTVKVLDINERGQMKLSRKALLVK